MRKWAQGSYTVINKNKYAGNKAPRYRSSWELAFMRFCDSNDHILMWASESIAIPYRHPVTGKMTNYIPDFLIQYRNKSNQVITELIEIKPQGQSVVESKAKAKDKMVVAVNHAKWQAARAWCKQQSITFRVLTENELFYNPKKGR